MQYFSLFVHMDLDNHWKLGRNPLSVDIPKPQVIEGVEPAPMSLLVYSQ